MYKSTIPFSLALFLGALLTIGRPVHAQQVSESWSTPINLSNMSTDSAYPKVVADQNGRVHVFWTENLPEYSLFNNVIYYSRLDGKDWSEPVDILTSPQGGLQAKADQPDVTVGKDGTLHLVFVGGWNDLIYYSSADSNQATKVRSWKPPVVISEDIPYAGYPNILLDDRGYIYVIFQSEQGQNQGIYQVMSKDNGSSWTSPTAIPGTTFNKNTITIDTRASISERGSIYVTWAWTTQELFPPMGIYYTRSDESGSNWSDPIPIVNGPYRYPDVLAVGDNQVFLVWSGTADDRYKFSRSSNDGGQTWSAPYKMTDTGGLQGYSGMALDSLGRVHIGMAASCYSCIKGNGQIKGDALIHRYWEGEAWSSPESLLENSSTYNNLQYADIAISEGNIANIVLMYPIDNKEGSAQKYQFDIFYVRGVLDVPHIDPQPIPTSILPTPTTELTSIDITNFQEPGSGDQSILPIDHPLIPGNMNSTTSFVIGAVPVGILLTLYIVLRKWISTKSTH